MKFLSKKTELIFNNISYGTDNRQTLDMIFDKNAVHVIVFIHGGAYFTGNKLEYPSFLLDCSKNNIFASIDYRVIETNNDIQMSDILSDVDDALSKIIEISNANGAKIKDFILVGHSAGGHIGLLYGYKDFLKNKRIKVSAIISLAGPTDFSDDLGWSSMTMWGKNVDERLSFLSLMGTRLTGHNIELKQRYWTKQDDYYSFKKYILDISPITYVSKTEEIPPTLLIHAQQDDQVPYTNSVRLKAMLDTAFVPNKLISPTGNGNSHMLGGIINANNEPIQFKDQDWVNKAKEWIETYLK